LAHLHVRSQPADHDGKCLTIATPTQANLILNIAPDGTGAIPAEDVARYKEMGEAIQCLFSKSIGSGGPQVGDLPAPTNIFIRLLPISYNPLAIYLLSTYNSLAIYSQFTCHLLAIHSSLTLY
jgi:hypothetical protein